MSITNGLQIIVGAGVVFKAALSPHTVSLKLVKRDRIIHRAGRGFRHMSMGRYIWRGIAHALALGKYCVQHTADIGYAACAVGGFCLPA